MVPRCDRNVGLLSLVFISETKILFSISCQFLDITFILKLACPINAGCGYIYLKQQFLQLIKDLSYS